MGGGRGLGDTFSRRVSLPEVTCAEEGPPRPFSAQAFSQRGRVRQSRRWKASRVQKDA